MIKDYRGRMWIQEEIKDIEGGYILVYKHKDQRVSLKFRDSTAISNDVVKGRLEMKLKSLGL